MSAWHLGTLSPTSSSPQHAKKPTINWPTALILRMQYSAKYWVIQVGLLTPLTFAWHRCVWLRLLPVHTFFILEGSDNEFANFNLRRTSPKNSHAVCLGFADTLTFNKGNIHGCTSWVCIHPDSVVKATSVTVCCWCAFTHTLLWRQHPRPYVVGVHSPILSWKQQYILCRMQSNLAPWVCYTKTAQAIFKAFWRLPLASGKPSMPDTVDCVARSKWAEWPNILIYFNTDTVWTLSGKSPLQSHKTTLKQQMDG